MHTCTRRPCVLHGTCSSSTLQPARQGGPTCLQAPADGRIAAAYQQRTVARDPRAPHPRLCRGPRAVVSADSCDYSTPNTLRRPLCLSSTQSPSPAVRCCGAPCTASSQSQIPRKQVNALRLPHLAGHTCGSGSRRLEAVNDCGHTSRGPTITLPRSRSAPRSAVLPQPSLTLQLPRNRLSAGHTRDRGPHCGALVARWG
jgi:hypothetical protein